MFHTIGLQQNRNLFKRFLQLLNHLIVICILLVMKTATVFFYKMSPSVVKSFVMKPKKSLQLSATRCFELSNELHGYSLFSSFHFVNPTANVHKTPNHSRICRFLSTHSYATTTFWINTSRSRIGNISRQGRLNFATKTAAEGTSESNIQDGHRVGESVDVYFEAEDDKNAEEVQVDNLDNATTYVPPWNRPQLIQRQLKRSGGNNNKRFRQHVNPLARQFQVPTILSDNWPLDVYNDCSKPLHLDIGCGKGGFLIDLIKKETGTNDEQQLIERTQLESSNNQNKLDEQKTGSFLKNTSISYNYLGLEIRPMVAQYAKTRIGYHMLSGVLDIIGCNANVDLDRILNLYHSAATNSVHDEINKQSSSPNNHNSLLLLNRVTIQFPDPHFKTKHTKRRVVTDELVCTLANYMPEGAIVYLQSDIQLVLDEMRERFRMHPLLFTDKLDHISEYIPNNIFSTPTEREVSVQERGLPVYRSLFTRTGVRQ